VHDVVAALHELAAAVAEQRQPHLPDLRDQQHRLEVLADAQPATLRGRRLAVLAAHLDLLVDAIDTVGHVLGSPAPLPSSATQSTSTAG